MKIESWEILMTSAITALDPGEAIAAAMRDLYDQLREIVDRGPTDDPGLLDELGKLTGRIRSRITRARKKAQPAEEPATSVVPAAGQPAKGSEPAPASERTSPQSAGDAAITTGAAEVISAPDAPSDAPVAADAPTVPRHRAVPAPTRRPDAVTVRLPRPAVGGRHRLRPARLPLWVHALVILLIVVGITLGTAVTAGAFVGVPVGAVVLGAAHWWNVRRATRGGVR